ncbi:hypothetical protein BGZ96_000231 [Linnemannia gamsii]|uniref:Uncharacterized protein n=1 Tax=Linnemannia gamsii TaxID=64522 RepID=A0ABQ7KAW3_9FUNG|nr:hypothetical protein BGZ96_000231 [Linnemannia gamsii]
MTLNNGPRLKSVEIIVAHNVEVEIVQGGGKGDGGSGGATGGIISSGQRRYYALEQLILDGPSIDLKTAEQIILSCPALRVLKTLKISDAINQPNRSQWESAALQEVSERLACLARDHCPNLQWYYADLQRYGLRLARDSYFNLLARTMPPPHQLQAISTLSYEYPMPLLHPQTGQQPHSQRSLSDPTDVALSSFVADVGFGNTGPELLREPELLNAIDEAYSELSIVWSLDDFRVACEDLRVGQVKPVLSAKEERKAYILSSSLQLLGLRDPEPRERYPNELLLLKGLVYLEEFVMEVSKIPGTVVPEDFEFLRRMDSAFATRSSPPPPPPSLASSAKRRATRSPIMNEEDESNDDDSEDENEFSEVEAYKDVKTFWPRLMTFHVNYLRTHSLAGTRALDQGTELAHIRPGVEFRFKRSLNSPRDTSRYWQM